MSTKNSKQSFVSVWEWAILRTARQAQLRLQEPLDAREEAHCLTVVEIAQDVAACLQARGIDPAEIDLSDPPPAPADTP